jgi:hypothetical protein
MAEAKKKSSSSGKQAMMSSLKEKAKAQLDVKMAKLEAEHTKAMTTRQKEHEKQMTDHRKRLSDIEDTHAQLAKQVVHTLGQ